MELETLIPQIDKLFARWDNTRSPGCALALIHEGEIVYSRGYGMASLEFGAPITPGTIFQIGSISKQFTAMTIAMLAVEGKLNLDDDVHKYLPQTPAFGNASAPDERITINHLVHHISGLRSIGEVETIAGKRDDDVTYMSDYLGLLYRQKALNFTPGERYMYCNTGFAMLGAITEKVSGKTLQQFCDERIFKPLGMKHTRFMESHRLALPGFAQSYAPLDNGWFEREILPHGLPGSTSLLTTVEDLLYWDREFYSGEHFGKAVIDLAHTVGVLNNGKAIDYAFGIHINQYRGLKIVTHTGSDAGFRSCLLRFPDERFTILILSNLSTSNPAGTARRIADLVLADKFTQPPQADTAEEEKLEPVTLPAEKLGKYSGLYFNPTADAGPGARVTLRGGKLTLDLGAGYELVPLSESLFYPAKAETMRIRFTRVADGKPLMQWLSDGEWTDYVKLEEPALDAERLAEYAGFYVSTETDGVYELTVRDGELWVEMGFVGEYPLRPFMPDVFALDISPLYREPAALKVEFGRAGGQITGLYVTSGRIKRMEFERM